MKTNRSVIAILSAAAIAALAPLAVSAQPYYSGNDSRYNAPRDHRGASPAQYRGHSQDNKHYRPGHDRRPVYVQPRQQYYAPPVRHYPVYEFSGRDRDYLNRHYGRNLHRINTYNRPVFVSGHVVPYGYRSHITPVPVSVINHLPPVPRGYRVGYVQGYNVVYDPATYMIISVLDLLMR